MHVGAADIVLVAICTDGEFADGGSVAQAQVQSLRADGRNNMRGFADQCDALVGKFPRRGDVERKQSASRLDLDLAEDRMGCAFDLAGKFVVIECGEFVSLAGSSTQTRLERKPGKGTKVNGPVGVWNSVEAS